VQHRQVDGPFDVELEPAALEQRAQAFPNPALLPEPAKGQIGAPPAHRHRLELTGRLGIEDREGLAVARGPSA